MFRNVVMFQNNPTQQYVPVDSVRFAPYVPPIVGQYTLPARAQDFPNRRFNKDISLPFMNVQTIYNYERSGKVQY